VWADPQAVRTALGQLLENAIKYSPDGGLVTVAVAHAAGEDAVEFSVVDQGIGLAPGEEEYLFMPFYQGETRARSGVRGGVGLGLSIVRRLVEAQGGRVGASGAPAQGSRFWFTLPVATAEHDQAE
jgi:signal transduction histidine kinase